MCNMQNMFSLITNQKIQYSKCIKSPFPLFIFLFTGVCVYLYFQMLKKCYPHADIVHKDPLNVKVFELYLIGNCSWWPVTHFCLFSITTFVFPQCWLLHFLLGVLWELFEKFYKIVIENSYKFSRTRKPRKYMGDIEYINWWDSSMKDIIFNSAGILVGCTLSFFLNRK